MIDTKHSTSIIYFYILNTNTIGICMTLMKVFAVLLPRPPRLCMCPALLTEESNLHTAFKEVGRAGVPVPPPIPTLN